MTLNDNTYASFMLDYAAGALSPAEALAVDLHRALSADGRRNGLMLDALGGALLESAGLKGRVAEPGLDRLTPPRDPLAGARQALGASRLEPFLEPNRLLGLPWRKDLFGMKTLPAGLPLANLLRLDPGERAPAHCHGRRDVTVVLTGSFADQFGVYERGDLAFAEPGIKHEPRAVGGQSCVCFLATEPGRPLSGFLGLLMSFLPGRAL